MHVRRSSPITYVLSPETGHRTSGGVSELFDMNLRAMRRDRAARTGVELFLYERLFADCLERIALVQRRFERALLIGCPDRNWSDRLANLANAVDTCDPGALLAGAARGQIIVEDDWRPNRGVYDLIVAAGTLDMVNNLPLALRILFEAMKDDALLIGAISGGETLPRLRRAMRAADKVTGSATAHVHPRIEAAALAPLLANAGFAAPVVDVDRIFVKYSSFSRLVADLRAMGATNILHERPRTSLSRAAYAAAAAAFEGDGGAESTVETFEILHFAAWKRSARIRSSCVNSVRSKSC